ncbi:YdeI/OmpD-associated family protein [Pedobacter sp. PWIIR3]
MEQVYDERVDAYIAKSADFAKPIMNHLRDLIHRAFPEMKETMKWSCPFFDYQGPVCQMAAFKNHLGFGFWKAGLMSDPYKVLKLKDETAGSFGQITQLSDLPSDEILIEYIQEAILLNKEGVKVEKVKAKVDPSALIIPNYLTDQLEQEPNAKAYFEKFSASQKKEYVVWLEEAKTEATKLKRLETAIEWIAEGKTRHWKYK